MSDQNGDNIIRRRGDEIEDEQPLDLINDDVTVDTARSGTERRDANACIALGTGVGALGLLSSVTLGAVCPMCYIVAPGLVAAGVYKRLKLRQSSAALTSSSEER